MCTCRLVLGIVLGDAECTSSVDSYLDTVVLDTSLMLIQIA
jgi:hypothetical protein